MLTEVGKDKKLDGAEMASDRTCEGGASSTTVDPSVGIESPCTEDPKFNLQTLNKAASMIVKRGERDKPQDVLSVLSLFPKSDVPTALADTIGSIMISNDSKYPRHLKKEEQICQFLVLLATSWNDNEKEDFLKRFSFNGICLDFATIILKLQYTAFDTICAISSDIPGTTIKLAAVHTDLASSLMELCSELFDRPMDFKLNKLRASKFHSIKFEIFYVKILTDRHLKRAIDELSSGFQIPYPIIYRRPQLQQYVVDICSLVKMGNISGDMAFRKCLLMIGDETLDQRVALEASTGQFHDQVDAKWIEIRGPLRGRNDTPCGRLAPSRLIGG
jgi:hypothetical protein